MSGKSSRPRRAPRQSQPITERLAAFGIEPKKSLGQNFMIDEAALDALAEAAGVTPDAAVLEVGPGLGALTDLLAARARRVVAVEIDGRLIEQLQARYAGRSGVEIVPGDILDVQPFDLMGVDADDYGVAANLPYYITSAVIRHLLECSAPPRRLAITVQREVAERITSAPGDMSLLAVSVQVYGAARIVRRLKPGSFYPPPKVESAILQIMPHSSPLIAQEERARFFRVTRAGFSQPRKQIKNALSAGLAQPDEAIEAWLAAVGVDGKRRAATLSVEEWLALARTKV